MDCFETWIINMWGEKTRVYKGTKMNDMIDAAEPYQGGWKDEYYKVVFTNCGYEILNY